MLIYSRLKLNNYYRLIEIIWLFFPQQLKAWIWAPRDLLAIVHFPLICGAFYNSATALPLKNNFALIFATFSPTRANADVHLLSVTISPFSECSAESWWENEVTWNQSNEESFGGNDFYTIRNNWVGLHQWRYCSCLLACCILKLPKKYFYEWYESFLLPSNDLLMDDSVSLSSWKTQIQQ